MINIYYWVKLINSGALCVDEMQGSQEKQTSRTSGTASEASTQLTQQFATSGNSAGSYAGLTG